MSDSEGSSGEKCLACGELVDWGCECDKEGGDDGADDRIVERENAYHTADGCKKDDPKEALDLYNKVI